MRRIRGHHILCIEGFAGKGYSTEFIENMRSVILELKNKKKVLLVNSPDDICKACPHLLDGRCVNGKGGEDEVRKMDEDFYEKTHLVANNVYDYYEVRRVAYEVFTRKSDLEKICRLCSWKRICRWYLSRGD